MARHNGAQTGFVYDGLNPVQELNGSTVIANLLPGAGIDEYLTRTDTSGVRHFLADALGSTLALSDGLGALPTSYTYAPFGATSLTGIPTGSAFDYTGREEDGTGLKYYRARYYHPGRQRFIGEDPIGFSGGDVNLFAYARNMPTRLRDPLGLFTVESDCDLPPVLAGRKDASAFDECGPVGPMYAELEADDRDIRGPRDQAWARSVGNSLERGAQRILGRASAGAKRGRTPEISGDAQRAENLWHSLRNGRPFEPHRDTTGGGQVPARGWHRRHSALQA